jgi:hypothetical protein
MGQHEVPLIPEADIMLISEIQARCFGIDIDSKSKQVGGQGFILFQDQSSIPLHLEKALMTCPLPVHWLTNQAPWDPGI